jgi:hypothetical protein
VQSDRKQDGDRVNGDVLNEFFHKGIVEAWPCISVKY